MKVPTFLKHVAMSCSIVSLLLVSAFGQVALRRPISADNPLIVVNTKLWLVDSVGTNTYYDIELHDAWANIPADLKPYCALIADPGKIAPTEADVEKWVSACQSIGAPCILQAAQCNRVIFDPDGSIADRLMKKYSKFLGYQWCEFQWDPVNFPSSNVAPWQAQLAKIAANGGYMLMADMAGWVWNSMGQNSTVMASLRQYKANMVALDKITDNGKYYWNQSTTAGFWLAGIVGNYGVSSDMYVWAHTVPYTGDIKIAARAAPPAIHPMMIEKSAAAGATVYMKFEIANPGDLAQTIFPLFRRIIQNKMIPTLAEARSQTKVGFQYAGTIDETSLLGGLYLNHAWMPNNGRYGLIPVFPQLATSTEMSFCERVSLGQFSSNAARQTFYNQRYPDNGITGTSWISSVSTKGCAYFANPNETEQSSSTSTFTYPLQRNSCQSLSATLQSYTYGILDEAPDSINIMVGDTMGKCTLPRSNVNTFVLKGISETRSPVLRISGQQSFTQNWDAGTQTYTLAVTHTGTVLITLFTSGSGTRPPTMVCTPSLLDFAADSGAAASTQNLTLANIGAGTLGTASVRRIVYDAGASSWLSTSVTGVGNSQQIAVQATPGTLAKGTYTASVVIQAVGTSPDSLVCPVTLTVSKIGVGAINAGGPAVGTFEADKFFSGGQTTTTTTSVSTAGVTNAAPAQVYQTERYGAMTYTITSCSPNAGYTVRLDFAEIYWTAAAQRTFNVRINGTLVLTDFDIFTAAGGAFKAVVKDYTATANSSGQIVVEFVNVIDQAKISALEWFPASATQARQSALRMNTAELFTAQFDNAKHLQIQVNQPGNHTVRIAAVNGATVKAFVGAGRKSYRLDVHAVSEGIYVVNVSAQGRHQSACVIARE